MLAVACKQFRGKKCASEIKLYIKAQNPLTLNPTVFREILFWMTVSWICSYSKHTWLILCSCCCHLFSTSTLKAWKACFKQLETFLLHQLVKLFVLWARPSQLTIYFPFNFYQFILDTAQTGGTGFPRGETSVLFIYYHYTLPNYVLADKSG